MNKKIAGSIIISLLGVALNANATDGMKTSNNQFKYSDVKTDCYKNDNKKEINCIDYRMDVFKEKVVPGYKGIQVIGAYNNDSPLVDLASLYNNKKYTLILSNSASSNQGEMLANFNEKIVPYISSIETKYQEDVITNKITKDVYGEGILMMGLKKSPNTYNVNLTQKYLKEMNFYKVSNEDLTLELPSLQKWNVNKDFYISETQKIRIDSPVYQKDKEFYKNIYILSIKDSKI